jgi:hypothetical protein
MERHDYYVYVYIDPRNFEEFYYGKGSGARKTEHLKDAGDSEKARRIHAIKAAGRDPLIRVIAANLSEPEALLVEKTLIWKLGRTLTNKSSGHYADKFRPHHTLHLDVPGFDMANDVYFVNVGEGLNRSWDDCKKFGFLSAGGGIQWRDQICRLAVNDVVVAYLKGAGYVGVGTVTNVAVPISQFAIDGKALKTYPLRAPNIYQHAGDLERCDYPVKVKWVSTVDRRRAFFKSKSGLYTPQLVRASLARQPKTVAFVEQSFDISIRDLLASGGRSTIDG